jgi:hypothetical protein
MRTERKPAAAEKVELFPVLATKPKIFHKIMKYSCKNRLQTQIGMPIITNVAAWPGLWLKVDASRRQNDPRKRAECP